MRIDKLSSAPDRAGRYRLEFEDGSVLRLYRQTVEDFGLFTGLELDESQLAKLREAAGQMSAKMRAVRIVSASSVSKRDLEQRLIQKGEEGTLSQRLYLLPRDLMAERWTGRRLSPEEAAEISGIADIRSTEDFEADFGALEFDKLYLDLFKNRESDYDRPAHLFAGAHPQLMVENLEPKLRKLRTIKQKCEIEALRKAEVAKYCCIVVSTVPAVILYIFMQKYFVKGVMIGSLKG